MAVNPEDVDKDILNEIKNATAYPLWVNSPDGTGVTTATPGTPSGSVGAQAAKAIGEALGWRIRPGDSKGFLAALKNTFQLQEVDGVVRSTWTPRNYAVQADLGEITGPQASLYTRAKAMLDNAIPLLNGLTPLIPDADIEICNAIRSLVSSSISELVAQLGASGGPVVQHVDALLDILFGLEHTQAAMLVGADNVGAQLGDLRRAFGLDPVNVNTVEDEQNLTNFYIFVDYIDILRVNWESQRKYFDRNNTDVYFGTQLVLLSRDLEAVADSVQEVYIAMDSVMLDDAERQNLNIKVRGQPPYTVAELLSWVEDFANVQGIRILNDGGKDGVKSTFAPLVRKLRDLTTYALNPSDTLPAAYRTQRVRVTLTKLREYLEQTYVHARPISGPSSTRTVYLEALPDFTLGRQKSVEIELKGARTFVSLVNTADDVTCVASPRYGQGLIDLSLRMKPAANAVLNVEHTIIAQCTDANGQRVDFHIPFTVVPPAADKQAE